MGLPNLAVSQRAQSLSVYDSGEEFTLGRVLFFRVGAQALMSLVTRVWCTHQVFLALMTINFGWYFCVRLAPVSVDKLVTTCAGMCTGVQQRHSPSSVTAITVDLTVTDTQNHIPQQQHDKAAMQLPALPKDSGQS